MTEQLRDRASRSLPTAAVRHGRLKRHSAWKTLLAVLGGTMAVAARHTMGRLKALLAHGRVAGHPRGGHVGGEQV